MRRAWHKWWLLAAVATGCSLDPQPSLPVSAPSSGGNNGAGGSVINIGDSPGTGDVGTGNTSNVGTGGSGTGTTAPDAGPPVAPGGEGGARGEAGASGEGGAAGETGAAGALIR